MQRVGPSSSGRSSPQGFLFTPGQLGRTMSAQQSSSSHEILHAVESGSVERVRQVLFDMPEGLKKSAMLQPSHNPKHGLRTPLMSAAATGDVAVFTTVMHSFEQLFSKNAGQRREQMRVQLLLRDRDGLTLAMHATTGGHVVVLASVMAEIQGVKAYEALAVNDHAQRTLLMHAAATGKAPLFREIFDAMETGLTEKQLEESMLMRSGEDRTLLMISAASGDKMAFKTCVESLQTVIFPQKFRALLKVRDADGMTFLMHAARPTSRRNNGQASAVPRSNTSQPRHRPAHQSGKMAAPISYPVMHQGALSPVGGFSTAPHALGTRESEAVLRRSSKQKLNVEERSAQENAGDMDDDGEVETTRDGSASPRRVRPGSPDERLDIRAARSDTYYDVAAGHAGEDAEMAGVGHHDGQEFIAAEQQRLLFAGCMLDPRVPVLKAAIALNKRCLWKEQVRDMLTAQDSWGRTLISHGILSGSPQVFEVAFAAVKNDVLDEEVEDLLECGDQYGNNKPSVMAKKTGSKEMESVVSRTIDNLKRDVQLRAKASTFETFQLLLPEVPWTQRAYKRLALLLVMSLLAPILAWASSLLNRRKSSNDPTVFVPRRSFYSYALSAPAMFVWGVGTSNIFEDGWGWPPSRAAAVLAVGTIVIPAVDSFVNSQRVEQWNDKFSLSRWRFSRQATVAWQKARAQRAKQASYDETVLQQPDLQNVGNAATAAPKSNLGGRGEGYRPFQEIAKEHNTSSTVATTPQAPAEVEHKSSQEV